MSDDTALRIWFDGKSVRVHLPQARNAKLEDVTVSTGAGELRLVAKIPLNAPVVIEYPETLKVPRE